MPSKQCNTMQNQAKSCHAKIVQNELLVSSVYRHTDCTNSISQRKPVRNKLPGLYGQVYPGRMRGQPKKTGPEKKEWQVGRDNDSRSCTGADGAVVLNLRRGPGAYTLLSRADAADPGGPALLSGPAASQQGHPRGAQRASSRGAAWRQIRPLMRCAGLRVEEVGLVQELQDGAARVQQGLHLLPDPLRHCAAGCLSPRPARSPAASPPARVARASIPPAAPPAPDDHRHMDQALVELVAEEALAQLGQSVLSALQGAHELLLPVAQQDVASPPRRCAICVWRNAPMRVLNSRATWWTATTRR